MSQRNPNQDPDSSQDWDRDASEFEKQLRAIRPTPPMQSWHSIAQSLEEIETSPEPIESVAVIPTATATSSLQTILSHSVTAALGLAVGIGIMFMQQPDVPQPTDITANSKTPNTAMDLAHSQNSNGIQPSDFEHQTSGGHESTVERQQSLDQQSRSHRFTQTNFDAGPLRAFGLIGNRFAVGHDGLLPALPPSQRYSPSENHDSDDTWQNGSEPVNRPILSPRPSHLLLDELTHTRNLNNRFCYAEGYSS